MKKLVLFISLFAGIVLALPASADEQLPTAYVFGDDACTLCKTEVKWLFDEGIPYQYLNINSNAQAKSWYDELLKKHDIHPITPLTIIGPEVIVGYQNEQTTGHDITRAVTKAKKSDIKTVEDHLARAEKLEVKPAAPCEGLACDTTNFQTMTLIPLLGLINVRTASFAEVSLILGVTTFPRLLSIGWLLISLGVLVLMPNRTYLALAGVGLISIELVCYSYFFNYGYHTISRFVVEATYADILRSSVGFLARQWYIALYSGIALIDNVLVTIAAMAAFPYTERFEDKRPGSVGMLSVALLFIGGACITYFIKFS